MMSMLRNKTAVVLTLAALLALATGVGWYGLAAPDAPASLIASNGRIEAVEVDVATRYGRRVAQILVEEGEVVEAGQVLAQMQIDTLHAQWREAQAQVDQAEHAVQAVQAAQAHGAMRTSEQAALEAVVVQRQSELDAARQRLARSEALRKDEAISLQELDDDRASVTAAQAALVAARAQVNAARAAVRAGGRGRCHRRTISRSSSAGDAGAGAGRTRRQHPQSAAPACNTGWRSPAKCSTTAARCSI